jgi:glycerate-2-kinase
MIVNRKIRNFEKLAVTEERRHVLDLLEYGLQSIDTKMAVKRSVSFDGRVLTIVGKTYDIADIRRIFVVGIGKCALEAVQALEDILGNYIHGGVMVDVHEGKLKTGKIQVFVGDHPLPTERNISVTKGIINLLKGAEEKDLVLFVISGGGSSLLCQPENLTCYEERKIVECLFRAGAPIQKINIVRKHLSLAKGGYLAQYAYPAKVVSLIFSDVPGNDLQFVASGPTVFDSTTIEDARSVLREYHVSSECLFVDQGLIETPKELKYFERVRNTIIVSNNIALQVMKEVGERKGAKAKIQTFDFSGHARHIGAGIVDALKINTWNTFLLYGGESTVVLKGNGRGGRNMEVALSALRFISDNDVIISLASDGRDNTEFAGGICDIITKQKAIRFGLDPRDFLNRNDSYSFFTKTGDYIDTGDTGSNVSDLIVGVRFKK